MQEQLIAELLRLGSTGSIAALFVWLLFTTHAEAKRREDRLHQIIEELTKRIGQLENEIKRLDK